MIYIGCDPGASGGVVALDGDNPQTDVDWLSLKGVDRAELALWFQFQENDSYNVRVLIEKVRSSPQMGVASAFSFGMAYERLWAITAALDMSCDEVLPRVWQAGLGIPPRKKKNKTRKTEETQPQFKERLRRKAKQLFPGLSLWQENLGIQRSVCDALLITEFLRRRET